MIFLGDLACPDIRVSEFTKSIENIDIFKDEIVVLNLEATIVKDGQCTNQYSLFNDTRVLDGFKHARKVIVSLANNHMYDYPDCIKSTEEYLQNNDIGVFGLCNNDGDNFEPYEYKTSEGDDLAFFGHCWRLYTQTNTNKVNNIRIVDHPYNVFIEKVISYIKEHPKAKVYCFMHWNYDLEKLPFPMHIKIARTLIDNGVCGVIGSHSHRPQGAEIYKGMPIVYGLGNFYLPSGVFFGGNLKYPECSKKTYGLSINNNESKIVWFKTDGGDPKLPVTYNGIESFDGSMISMLSPFRNMDFNTYVHYFLKNRSKKFLVPVFKNYLGALSKMKEAFAILRVNIIRKIK